MKALRIHLEGTVWLITLRGRQIIIYHTTLPTEVSGTGSVRRQRLLTIGLKFVLMVNCCFFLLPLDQRSTLRCCVWILIINDGLSGPRRKSKKPTPEKSPLNSKNLLQIQENLA